MDKIIIYQRVYGNHSKSKQLLLNVPKKSGIVEKDIVKIERITIDDVPEDQKKRFATTD